MCQIRSLLVRTKHSTLTRQFHGIFRCSLSLVSLHFYSVINDHRHYCQRSDQTRHVHAYLSVRKLCTYHVQVQKCLFHEIGVVRRPIPSQTREPGVYPVLHWQMVGVSSEPRVLHSNG